MQIDLLKQFDQNHPLYSAFAEKLRLLVYELLSHRNLNIHSVTSRAKTHDSFARKINKAEGRYAGVADVTDCAGVRVVTYFEDDVDRVAEAIKEEFTIDETNSIDKRDLLDPDRFGYLSLHYVISLSSARATLLEYQRYAGLKVEVQIRSILQHAWAEIEHDLGYKTASGVPRGIRRQFSRLAGLLEIADIEFASIRDALNAYEAAVSGRIEEAPESVEVDKASLKAFVASNETFKRITREIAAPRGGEILPIPDQAFESAVTGVIFLGLRTIGGLEEALRTNEPLILRFAYDWLKGGSGGGVGEGVALLYLGFVKTCESGPDRIRGFLDASNIEREESRQALVDKILQTYKRLVSEES